MVASSHQRAHLARGGIVTSWADDAISDVQRRLDAMKGKERSVDAP
jgi:hypothetical protein